jgi:hypothetical protein
VPVAFRVWDIVAPVDAVAPATPDCTTVQANVVPVTVLLRATEVDVPEQMVCDTGVAVATGVGLTVTTTVIGDPAHELAVGVTV